MAFWAVQPLAHQITGENHAGAAQTGAAMHRHAEVLLVGSLNRRDTAIKLLLLGCLHVGDRLVENHQAGIVDPIAAQSILGERHQHGSIPLAPKPGQLVHRGWSPHPRQRRGFSIQE